MGTSDSSDIVPEKQGINRKPGTWPPGVSGNPNGRPPKGHSITDIISQMMDEKPEIKRALGSKVLELALKEGDMTAIKLIWSYLDGMPKIKQEITGKDGEPLVPTPIYSGKSTK